MSTRIPIPTIITEDPTRPDGISEPSVVSSLDRSQILDIISIQDTELYREEIPAEIEEQPSSPPSLPRTSRIPAINLTVDGEIKQVSNTTVTNITQVINNSYITQKIEPQQGIGGRNKTIQFNFNNKFDGSLNLTWDALDAALDVIGNAHITDTVFATDITTLYGNSIVIDTGHEWDFTENSLALPNYTLPASSGTYGQLFITAGDGNVFWESPESSYQLIILMYNSDGVVNHDCSLGSVFSHYNIENNIIPNFINLNLAPLKSTNILIKLNQGATAFNISEARIDGVTQSILWDNSDLPVGTEFKTDIISFTIINISSSYLIFGQLMSFG